MSDLRRPTQYTARWYVVLVVDRPTDHPDHRLLPSEAGLAEVVARAMRHDPDAWRELLSRYTGRVFALIQSRVQNRDLAEEMSQAVFVRVVEEFSKGRYREEGRFEAWLFRIAMNMVRDSARKAKSRGPTLQLRPEDSQQPATPTTADLQPLRSAIDQLPDADREIIHLRHQAGLSFQTIADLLDQPVGTLLARHHRAIGKVRAMLDPETTSQPARGSA